MLVLELSKTGITLVPILVSEFFPCFPLKKEICRKGFWDIFTVDLGRLQDQKDLKRTVMTVHGWQSPAASAKRLPVQTSHLAYFTSKSYIWSMNYNLRLLSFRRIGIQQLNHPPLNTLIWVPLKEGINWGVALLWIIISSKSQI